MFAVTANAEQQRHTFEKEKNSGEWIQAIIESVAFQKHKQTRLFCENTNSR